jgi:hypothetical protein
MAQVAKFHADPRLQKYIPDFSKGVDFKTLPKRLSETTVTPYDKLVHKLAAKGSNDPKALAAWIGRKKLGKAEFQRRAKAGMK